MAIRPVFKPLTDYPYVQVIPVEFKWYPGFARLQVQKSLLAFHSAAKQLEISSILEISSKSTDPLGVSLSAFNIKITPQNAPTMTVECAFQGSKVFKRGGPFHDLYNGSSMEAKKDSRLRNSGDLVAFNYLGESFPITPVTAFYDWLYINALSQNPRLSNELFRFQGFSDIAFNPKKSLNCQAYSAALFTSLKMLGEIDKVLRDKKIFLNLLSGRSTKKVQHNGSQLKLKF